MLHILTCYHFNKSTLEKWTKLVKGIIKLGYLSEKFTHGTSF